MATYHLILRSTKSETVLRRMYMFSLQCDFKKWMYWGYRVQVQFEATSLIPTQVYTTEGRVAFSKRTKTRKKNKKKVSPNLKCAIKLTYKPYGTLCQAQLQVVLKLTIQNWK